jgi:hypothetical protein
METTFRTMVEWHTSYILFLLSFGCSLNHIFLTHVPSNQFFN